MKRILFLLFAITITVSIYSQTDYYVKDSALTMGVTIIDQGIQNNQKSCKIQLKDSTFSFSPNQITEYSFGSSDKYFSKTFTINGVSRTNFLLRLDSEAPFVYYFQDEQHSTFFIEKESNKLVELTEQNYRSVIEDFTSHCSHNKEKLKFLTYSRLSFERYFSNTDYCKTKHTVYFKWGILAGAEATLPSLKSSPSNPDLKLFQFPYTYNCLFGVFVDYPIGKGNLSLHPELYIAKNGYSVSKHATNKDYDFISNITTANLPILLRYTASFGKLFPFINIGPTFSYVLREKSYLNTATINTSSSTITIDDNGPNRYFSSQQLGMAAGIGVEYKLNYKHALFVEARVNQQYGFQTQDFSRNNLQLIISFNL